MKIKKECCGTLIIFSNIFFPFNFISHFKQLGKIHKPSLHNGYHALTKLTYRILNDKYYI